jgi:hypothetical protein
MIYSFSTEYKKWTEAEVTSIPDKHESNKINLAPEKAESQIQASSFW